MLAAKKLWVSGEKRKESKARRRKERKQNKKNRRETGGDKTKVKYLG